MNDALEGTPAEEIAWTTQEMELNKIVDGRVLRVEGDVVLVDVGYKSEGIIFRNEWEEGENRCPSPARWSKSSSKTWKTSTAWWTTPAA